MKHALLALVLSAFAMSPATAPACFAEAPPANFAQLAEAALSAYPSAGLAVTRIERGEIVWSAYAGEQAPGVPVTAATLFNTASIAKTLTAELLLRLAEAGELSLDEPISSEYIHPDLAGDPRYDLLTPAIMLSHQAGLKNWPYSYEDGHLAFIQNPGAGLTYSGIGYEILAEFAARRMGETFPDLVAEWILRPSGLEGEVFLGAEQAPKPRRAMPMGRDGEFAASAGAEFPPSAADNLFVTAPTYARLLLDMMPEAVPEGLPDDPRVISVLDTSDFAPCTMTEVAHCPIAAGQSLGWSIARFSDRYTCFTAVPIGAKTHSSSTRLRAAMVGSSSSMAAMAWGSGCN